MYANGQAVGVTRSSNYVSNERAYFGTDLMGTVRSATTDSGNAEYYEYDVFGKPYGEIVSDFAYTGKPYDPVTGMYNYGYRDYVPQTACFTTIDPIRDGSNWFAYCNGDPVNFWDLWGLFFKARTASNKMNQGEWAGDTTGNGIENESLRNTGCAVAEMSNVVSSETQQNVTPRDINRNKDNFASGTDKLNMQKVAEDNGLEFDYWTKGITNLGTKLVDLTASDDAYYVSAQVKYNEDDDTHWVGVENVVENDGKLYIEITGSSVNDTNKANRRRETWVKDERGKMLVEVNDIEKIYTYKSNKNK